MTKFIVDRETWYRGKGFEDSKLLREDGMRCCIGFVGQQCGISDSLLLNVKAVQITGYEGKWPEWTTNVGPGAQIFGAYAANDNPDITDIERELILKAIFASNGDEIEFINGGKNERQSSTSID